MEDALREIRSDIEEGLLDETPQYREYLLSIIEDQQTETTTTRDLKEWNI